MLTPVCAIESKHMCVVPQMPGAQWAACSHWQAGNLEKTMLPAMPLLGAQRLHPSGAILRYQDATRGMMRLQPSNAAVARLARPVRPRQALVE